MTSMHTRMIFALALGGALFSASGAHAADDWETLGCTTVSFNVDKDVITVGKRDGVFSRIKLRVKDAPIEFYEVRVVFGNGQHQNIKINQKVPAGSESQPIDLEGVTRGIDHIDLFYRSIPTFKGKSEVCVSGKSS